MSTVKVVERQHKQQHVQHQLVNPLGWGEALSRIHRGPLVMALHLTALSSQHGLLLPHIAPNPPTYRKRFQRGQPKTTLTCNAAGLRPIRT
jgi:hypothetical protein